MSLGKVGKVIAGAVLITVGIFTGQSWLIAIGANLAAGALIEAIAGRQSGIEANTAGTVSWLPVAYGTVKLGLRLVDMREDPFSSHNEDLYIVGALCHGSEDGSGIAGIDEIYFDDKLAFDAAGVAQSPYGSCTVTKYLGTDAQTVDTTLNTKFPVPWPSSSKGARVAYIVLKLKYDKDVLSGIPNVTVIVRGNKCYDPRTTGTAFTTNPALQARDYLKSSTYGFAADDTEIDDTAIQDEANYCEQQVDVPGDPSTEQAISAATAASPIVISQTAHGYNTGDKVTIRQLGVTGVGLSGLVGNWTITKIGTNQYSLDGSSGTGAYVANSAGATKMVQQNRFEGNGWVVGSSDPKDNLRIILSACRGNSVHQGGKFRVFIRKSGSATSFALTEDNIIGDFTYQLPGIAASPNSIEGRFINAANDYKADDLVWPRTGPGEPANTYLTEDNGFDTAVSAELPFTVDKYMAEQIIMVQLKEARSGRTVTLVAKEEALQLQAGDIVPVTHSDPGWTAKEFWVMGIGFRLDRTVEIALMEYDANAYSLDPHTLFPATPATDLPDPSVSQPPTGLTALSDTTTSIQLADGTWIQRIYITWTRAASDPFLDHYEIEYKKTADSIWDSMGTAKRDSTDFWVSPVAEHISWDVRIRAINVLGFSSTWVSVTITPGDAGTNPLVVSGLVGTWVGGDLQLVWNLNTDADQAGYEVREGGTDWASANPLGGLPKYFTPSNGLFWPKSKITQRSYTFRIKAENTLGLQGNEATVTVNFPAPDSGAISALDITVSSQSGQCQVEVDGTACNANQFALYASLTNGFSAGDSTRKANITTTKSSPNAILQFMLPVSWLGQTIYLKIGLKDELTDIIADGEVFTSQFTATGGRVVLDDVADGSVFARIRGNAATGGIPNTGIADDFSIPTPGRRWTSKTGGGSADNQQMSDSEFGGNVFQFVGYKWYEWTDNIPFDPNYLYAIKFRVRQRKDPTSGTKSFYLGVAGVGEDGSRYVNVTGIDNFGSQYYVCASARSLTQSPVWTEYIGYIQGYAGAAFALTSGMLTNSGLANFSAANAVDGDHTTKAFDTNAGVALGSSIVFDLGTAKDICALRMYLKTGTPSSVRYKLSYGDSASGPWTTAFTGWTPTVDEAWNERMTDATTGTHQYWKLETLDAGAAGCDVMDVELIDRVANGNPGGEHWDPDSPATVCYGVKYLRPLILGNYSTGVGGAFEVDLMVMPLHAATMAAMLRDDQQRKFETFYLTDGVLSSGVLVQDGSLSVPFIKGRQTGITQHNATVTFAQTFATIPKVTLRGGANYEPRSLWGTVAQVNAGTAATAPASLPQLDDVSATDLTGSGFTTRGLLRQKTGSPTNNTLNFSTASTSTVGASLTALNMTGTLPSYNDRYYVKAVTKVSGKAKYADLTAVLTIAVDVDIGDGNGFVERQTSQHIVELPVGVQITDDTKTHTITVDVSGVGVNDDFRIRVVSFDINGVVYNSSFTCYNADGTTASPGVQWTTVSDQFASKTPDGVDDMSYVADGYLAG